MKAFRTILAGILGIIGMCCFVGTFMQFQESPLEGGALFVTFLALAWICKVVSPEPS